MRVSLIAPKSSVTGGQYRVGASLRISNPPAGVSYVVREASSRTNSKLDSYRMSPLNLIYWLNGAVSDHLNPPNGGQIVHSFFWNYFNLWSPWIHENDSSLSQYLGGYFGVRGGLMRRLLKLSSAILNASSCKRVLVWSMHAKQGMIEDGVKEEKVDVIPPPIAPKRVSKQAEDAVTITFVGRDYDRKGGRLVIDTFRELSRSYNLKLNYVGSVGDAARRNYLLSEKSVNYQEFMMNRALHSEIYPNTDIFVLPTKAEAFGLTVLEAMSYGIPVLASDLPIINELLDGYSKECTFRLSEPGEFAEKLSWMIENQQHRKRVGGALKALVEARYSPSVVNPKLSKIYTESAE